MSFPVSPVNNQQAVVNGVAYIYASATRSWARVAQTLGVPYTASTTPPTSPRVGDQWYYTTGDILYEYQNVGTGTFWIDITSPTVTTGNITVPGGDAFNPFLLMGA